IDKNEARFSTWEVGMNKEIQDNYGVALKQSNVTRWLSLSNLLESIEISIEHARSIISSKPAAVKQKVCINKINTEDIKDLVCLLKPFKHVATLVQTVIDPHCIWFMLL
ncbi:unnamed protein product, partial [Didymodactylos carnosus]